VSGVEQFQGNQDNSFGQGTKEADPNVSVVTGSIPPQKSDLTRFCVASEFTNNSNYLYPAWERTNVLGSANMDFEINKLVQPDLTTTGPKTLNRSAGDLLVTFDFTNGGGNPVLGLKRWITAAAGGTKADCFSANGVPCWGALPADDALDGVDDNQVNLSQAGFAEGAVNASTVTDPISGASLPGLTFGEAAINLSAAGVFPPGTCTAFGSAFLKSRSSASFPAEVKDFVAPQPVNITNCGTLVVKKVTQPSPDPTDTSFAFTVNGPNPPNTGLPKSFSLKNGGSNSTQVFAASNAFSASETVPANWELVSATCDNGTGTLSGSTISAISVGAEETVTCTFTDRLKLGAITITKTSTKDNSGLAGAKFSIESGGTPIPGSPFTTGSDGTVCVDGLLFGTYSVKEVSAPTGYRIDDTAAHDVVVDNNATCSGGGGESISFADTRCRRSRCSSGRWPVRV
jgi:hypothetical protein